MTIQVICAFFAIFSFSVIINVPKKYLWTAGAIGAAGWLIYLLLAGQGVVWATFGSAGVIAILAHISARKLKSPVSVFLIPGILTIVPGAGMYNTVYQLLAGEQSQAMGCLLQTLELAGSIAMAIFIVDSIVYLIPKKRRW